MSDQTIGYGLVGIAFALLVLILLLYRTVLFGFTLYGFLNIASASFAGLFSTHLFGFSDYWISSEHRWVFIYSALGLIAYCVGVLLAWRPLQRAPVAIGEQMIQGLSERTIMLCLGLGALVALLAPIATRLPTLRTIWGAYGELLRFGVLLALVYALVHRRARPLIIATVVFVPVVLYQVVFSGFIGLGGFFLLQLLVVACFWRGLRIGSLAIALVGAVVLASLMVGWLSSRYIIREGRLEGMSSTEQVTVFLQEFNYVSPLALKPAELQDAIFERVDMTNILAAQVEHQPERQSYAYGDTVLNELAAAMVPRFLWPDKPSVAGGSEFVSRYSGLVFGEGTSVGLPYQFELYANGGVWAVSGGLFAIGWLVARLELTLLRPQLTLTRRLVLLFLTGALAGGAQSSVVLLTSILAGVVGFVLLGTLLQLLLGPNDVSGQLQQRPAEARG